MYRKKLNEAIAEKGKARMILSTGASQFDMFRYLVDQDVDWKNVEMFHLDEPISVYLNQSGQLSQVSSGAVHEYCAGDPYTCKYRRRYQGKFRGADRGAQKRNNRCGVIGIGENGHIAFNDPPADFDTREAYKVVDLDEKCRMQQVGEGWFHHWKIPLLRRFP